MESREKYREDVKLLEMLNDNLGREVKFLHESLRHERDVNELFLKRLGFIGKVEKNLEEFEPVGGYTRLTDRIAQAEEKSRMEYEKEKEREERQGNRGTN
jgi:hypothetical protein